MHGIDIVKIIGAKMRYLHYKIFITFFICSWLGIPMRSIASVPEYFNYSNIVNTTLDLSSLPEKTAIWDGAKVFSEDVPSGDIIGHMYLTCLSDTDATNGACPVNKGHWVTGGDSVKLKFVEERTHISKILILHGWINTPCGPTRDIANVSSGCGYWGQPKLYIYSDQLKRLFGGIWKAHLKLQVGELGGGAGSYDNGLMNAYMSSDITLHVTDNNNIRIWLPQFHGSTANVVMPVMPAYWTLNKPGQVSAEKVIETCLYDGYSSNSKSFEVTLNSNYTEPATQDFLLQNSSAPTSKPLHYQVIASPPGQAGTMQRLKPGVTQTYVGINTAGIRQVMMPGLQTPVACVPWPIRIKLLPFDLSRQAAGHYSGTLSIIFTPSLD
ncbi:hypothetical protein IIK98_004244 [Salmonella enterica subsp. enterica serovar Stanley]|nr:CfaE/CblD family pilus tip adhesin [Salmonella enterica]EDN1768129.1 hypothetical protein [Salmonella enterica subsp. enterica serovar Stanley]EJG9185921.1 hypothetical protein [Salmonella enterica subsp. enterica serovar Bareilly]EEO7136667.1 hypothetical protein [Salmonella enterica]EGM4826818.1 hypothetical protein [Salmonella enterica subsp. enterica serovar Stanley]EGP4336594.1 hypothetical protein [Salmonella enterica]